MICSELLVISAARVRPADSTTHSTQLYYVLVASIHSSSRPADFYFRHFRPTACLAHFLLTVQATASIPFYEGLLPSNAPGGRSMKRIVPVTRNVLLIVLSIHFLLVTFLVPHTSPLLLTKDELGHFPFVIPNPASSTTASLDGQHAPTPSSSLGAIVLLAPQRNKRGYGHVRTCLLRNALQSIDVYLNAHHGPYDVYVLVASDYILDPERRDGPYSDADRAALQAELNHTNLTFVEIKMYSDEALEPNLDMRQFVRWNQGLDGGTAGRNIGYRSMCRLWSGRLQHMDFMKRYKYYVRMDDDSLSKRGSARGWCRRVGGRNKIQKRDPVGDSFCTTFVSV